MTTWTDILDFEAEHQATARPAKIRAMRAAFGIGESIYTYRLMRAIEEVDALAYRPALVTRLREQRERLHQLRTGGTKT